jgi:hypothetical protein
MSKYVHFRCPNLYRQDSDIECRHTLGGPAIETLKVHDWDFPYIDTRYCPDCKAYYRITIRGMHDMPKFVMIDRDKKMPFTELENVFPLVKIQGRRITRNT